MEINYHPEFEKDIKRIDGQLKNRLRKAIEKISINPLLGKPLKHLHGVFSKRILNFRLIYRITDGKLTIICFKNRDDVYNFIKGI